MGKEFNARDKYDKTKTSGGEGGDIRRLKLSPGKNIIRIVEDNFEEAWIHHFENKDGDKRRAICLGKGKCPICNTGNKATHRFYFNVIDRKEQKVDGKTIIRLFECGKMIYEPVRELALDEEYGNPTQYNLKINRVGEGKKTKYGVQASTKKYPLTDKEQAIVDSETSEGGAYDLSMFVTKQTKAELLEILNGEEADDGEKDEGEEGEDSEKDTSGSRKNRKNKDKDEDLEGDEDEEGFDIDKELQDLEDKEEDEDEPTSKKKKKKVTKDEDEDEDEDEDGDEEW